MPDDISDIRAFYDRNVDKEDSRLERHQIERDITWRFLEKYLPSAGRILDIGAGTGSYAVPLAQRGYSVTAADISPTLMEACEKRALEAGMKDRLTCLVADARDLSGVTGSDFDAVLLLGPLYHLVLEEDRKTAVQEAFAKMKPGGIIFSSFISRYGIWGDLIRKFPHHIEQPGRFKTILEKGLDADFTEWDATFRAYFTTPAETIPVHEQEGFETLTLAGIEPAGIAADESYKDLTDSQRKLWLDLLFSISTEQSSVGASCHLLYIGQKPAGNG